MNIGIVGLGHLGKIHLKLLSENNSFKVNGVYDINDGLSHEISSSYNVYGCKSFEELVNRNDAICIVTPTPTHYELAAFAIKLGKHVFIEKPSTVSVDETKSLIKYAHEAAVLVQIGHVERFNPAYITASNLYNKPSFFEINRFAKYNNRGTDVSVVLDLMIHDIDLVLNSVKSSVKKIEANGFKIVSDSFDFVSARLEFANGVVANLTTNRVANENIRVIKAYQENQIIIADLLHQSVCEVKLQKVLNNNIASDSYKFETNSGEIYQQTEFKHDVANTNAIKEEMACFYDSIINHKAVKVSLNDALNALTVVQHIENQLKS